MNIKRGGVEFVGCDGLFQSAFSGVDTLSETGCDPTWSMSRFK